MALFKINKGLAENLAKNMPYAKEGFAYFTKDDGKFYIDIAGDGTTTEAVVNVNRIPLNAAKADVATMIQATAMATDDNKVYPILAFNITDSTKNLVEAKYSQIGIKNGTLVIPSIEDKDEILISNEGLGRGIVIDNKGTNNAIEILNGKGIKVAQDPTDDLELATKQYVDSKDNIVLQVSLNENNVSWLDYDNYTFTLSTEAQNSYSKLNAVIQNGLSPQVVIQDSYNIRKYIFAGSFYLETHPIGIFTLESAYDLNNNPTYIITEFITFALDNTTLTSLNISRKNAQYLPCDGNDGQILIYYSGTAQWVNIPSIDDLGGAAKDHNHDATYKKIQTAVFSPAASSTDISFIDTVSQDTQGKITATKKTVRDASKTQSGVVSTGAQTFAGNKTFEGKVVLNKGASAYVTGNADLVFNTASANTDYAEIYTAPHGTNANKTRPLVLNANANGSGNVGIGITQPTEKLEVNGNVKATQFKGNADTADKWKTARKLTIGSVDKNVDGSANVSWTLDEINVYSKNDIDNKLSALLGANDALVFKGIIDGKHPLPTANYEVGHTYRVNEAGTYAGQKCEQGDLIICIADALSTSTPHWTVAQTNIDGAVIGPNGATDNNIALFNDATGKLIKDSGKKLSDFATADHNHTITANANDDDIVVLTGASGTNAITYTASHAKKGPNTTANTTKGPGKDVSISGAGKSGSITIPKVTVDTYGHTIGLTEQKLTITLPNDTHHQSSTVITNSAAEKSNAASENDNTYLNHIENGVVRSAHKIVGAGSTKVSSDANGVLTITSENTVYSHPTTPGNLHLPAGGKVGDVLLCAGDNTGAGKWGIDPNIKTAIEKLNANEVGGEGKYIKAIKQVDGKIVATEETIDTALSTSSTKPVQNNVVNTALGKKVNTTTFNFHVNDTDKHITTTERTNWNTAYTHSQSAHAPTNAEKNQNAFSNIQLNTDTTNIIKADNATDTLTLKSGSNIQITGDVDTDTITISATDTKYNNATTSAPGLMSAKDKEKLDSIASGANNYSHPTFTKNDAAAVKVGNDEHGHVVLGSALTKSDVGLSNVGNFLAVSTAAKQNLTEDQKSNARANIGAGTSSLTIGTGATNAAAGNHTHKYAGSASAGGPANSTKGTLTLKAGKNIQTFNGSGDKTFTITASDLGLSTAMHFIGIATKGPIVDNFDPGIANYSFTKAQTGDVIISKDGDQEYVLIIKTDANNIKTYHWELLGPNGSYAISDHKHSSADTTSMTGYTKGTAKASITTKDTLNTAIGKLEYKVDNKVDQVSGKGLSTNDFTNAYKTKLDGIETGAQKNQNAFSNIQLNTDTTNIIKANSATDTLTLVAGSNVTLTPDVNNDKITIAATNTDTKVTAVGNHYTPAADSKATLSADASSTIAATWNTTSLVTGVNLQRDAKGHVTGVTVDSIKMPANPNTNTHYTSKNIIGGSATATANAAATNGNVHLNHLEESTVKSTHKIIGAGATTVTSDGSGNITITSKNDNTDTKVTQNPTTSNVAYPLLLAPTGQTTKQTTEAYFDSGVTLNPSTNTIAANITGNAGSANKVNKNLVIKLNGGTTEGTNQFTYNGSAAKTVDITPAKIGAAPSTSQYEAYLKWGGRNLSSGFSPVDANLNGRLGANRLAGIKPAGVTIEYSNDGGSTWTDYGLTNDEKVAIFTMLTCPKSLRIAGPTAAVSANSKLRITLDGVDGSVYTQLNKLHIYVSTSFSNNCTVSLESYDYNSSTEWHSVIKNQSIVGWSGWNVLNFTLPGSTAFGGTNQTTHQRKIRLTFSNASITAGKENEGLRIYNIYGYGGMGWTAPSVLATNGVPYTYDNNLVVSFPNHVKSSLFDGNASTASKWKTAKTFKIGNCSKSVDGSDDITWPLSDIGAVNKAGDTMTGDLKVGSSSIGTNGYIIGTWLKTTADISSNVAGNFAIIKDGWIYSRTPAQAREDMGLSTAMHFIGKATVDITDGSTTDPKITGYTTKTAGDVIIDKNNSYEYVWTLENKWERLGPDGSYSVVGHNHDDKYVIKSGDTMTGTLEVLENGISSNFNCDGVSLANNSILLRSGGYEDYEYLQLGSGSQRPDIFIDRPGNSITSTPSLPRDENIPSEAPALSIRGNNLRNGFTFYIDKHTLADGTTETGRGKLWLRSLDNYEIQLKGVYIPEEDTDAANKYYVDDQISTKNTSLKNSILDTVSTTYVKKAGDTMSGNLDISRSDANDAHFRATNSNGSIGLLTSTNQGLYDYTNSKWIAYHNKSDGINYFNGLATKATQDKNGSQIDTTYVKKSGDTITGELAFTNANAIRFVQGSGTTKSVLMRNDGNNFYIITCNATSGNSWYIPSGGLDHSFRINLTNGFTYVSKLYGAVWNDYAEFRQGDTIEAGHCVIETGDDTLITSTERMMPGANITSDTFGFAIGETEQAKTPIAVSGRVLAYPYESREEFKKNIGRPVCSGPNGTVSIMTDEEYKNKGYCAIGTISAVPDYEEWGTGKVKVNGRVWIKVF